MTGTPWILGMETGEGMWKLIRILIVCNAATAVPPVTNKNLSPTYF